MIKQLTVLIITAQQLLFTQSCDKGATIKYWLLMSQSFIVHCWLSDQILAFSALTLLTGRQEEHLAYKTIPVTTDEVLVCLSVCSEVQMICISPSWCHCHAAISCFIKIQIGSTILVPAYPDCPGKEAVLSIGYQISGKELGKQRGTLRFPVMDWHENV